MNLIDELSRPGTHRVGSGRVGSNRISIPVSAGFEPRSGS